MLSLCNVESIQRFKFLKEKDKIFFSSYEKYTVAVNPLNGATVNTSALVAALIKFTQIAYTSYEIYGRMSYKNKPVSIQTYDRVRYLVLKLDNKAYAEVLD